jgi:hypothetical protein
MMDKKEIEMFWEKGEKVLKDVANFYLDLLSGKEIVTDVDLNMRIGWQSKLKFITRTYISDKEKKYG